MFLYLKDSLSYHIRSAQGLIICEVTCDKDSLILAFICPSLSSNNENSKNFYMALKHLSHNLLTNFLVICDVNYTKLEWDYYASKSNDRNFKYIEYIRDSFF